MKKQAGLHIDAIVRLFHILILFSFFIAYFTGDHEDLITFHIISGYTIVVALIFRLIWQFFQLFRQEKSTFGVLKRCKMVLNLLKIFIKNLKESHSITIFKSDNLKLIVNVIIQISIIALCLIMPLTVAFGYLTFFYGVDYDYHEFLADFFMVMVILHISSVLVLSILNKKIDFYKIFFGQMENFSFSKVIYSIIFILGVLMLWKYCYLDGNLALFF
nr:cytochrome b/b6 domain-containing protein [Acinetobacter sp. Marseille-Q1620]